MDEKTLCEQVIESVTEIRTLAKNIEIIDGSINKSLTKFSFIGTVLIGLMLVHLCIFGVWTMFVSATTSDIRREVELNRTTGEKRDDENIAKMVKIEDNQKAILESTAENNYAIHGHDAEMQQINNSLLKKIEAVVMTNKDAISKVNEIVLDNKETLCKLKKKYDTDKDGK